MGVDIQTHRCRIGSFCIKNSSRSSGGLTGCKPEEANGSNDKSLLMVVLVLLMTSRNEMFYSKSGLTSTFLKDIAEFRESVKELLSNNSTIQHCNNQAFGHDMSQVLLKYTYVNRSLFDTATMRHFCSDTHTEDNATILNEGLHTLRVAEENTFLYECINRTLLSIIKTHLMKSGVELNPGPIPSIPRGGCYLEGKRNISNSSTPDCTKDSHSGKAIPRIGSVEADSFWGTHIFKMDLSDDTQSGLRNKNTKRAKSFAISRILDEFCTFGEYCQLETPPLFYLWKRNAFVVLPSVSWWKELERTFTVVDVYPAAFLAFRNEFRQSFVCRDGHKLSFLNKLILHGHVASINFYDITVTNPFGGFHGTSGNRNSRHIFPDTNEKHTNPLNKSADQDKYPTQVSEDDVLFTEGTQTELVRDENTESPNPMSSDVLVYNATVHNDICWESLPTIHTDSVNSVREIRNSSNRLDRMELNHLAINGYQNARVGNSSNDRLFSNGNSRSLNTATYLQKQYPGARYPDYENAISRRETYRGWQLAQPNPDTLCSAGFFFTGQNYDLVRCFCCGIGLKDFTDTDDPMLEHVKHSANCPFMIDHFGSREAIEQYKQTHLRPDPEEIRQRQRQLYQQQQGRPISNYRAKHERFRSLSARLDTFTNWPPYLSQRPEQLAEAGMYYTGIDDHCRCFACDGGLRKWEPGDDPWIEHCRWFPACPYAREVKGDEFIDLVQLSADQAAAEHASNQQDEVNGAMAALNVDDRIVQQIVHTNQTILTRDMGFTFEDVRKAVLELVQQGNSDPNMDDIVLRLEIIKERTHIGELFHIQESTSQPNKNTLLEQNQRLKDLLMCHICHKNQANALFLPCTHHKYCLECTQHSDMCPDCGRPIKQRIRTYMG
ncbi:uncharacterized protein LOC127851656 isoform X3 [Dreissena polymorpha]|uniref:RING-type domain-containing protein n=2 Tax=Dreissena polymorpha TaxID=45954 RepID=A0A9D4D2B3_DREPO|nr:uncharacterized protein LOC127851656 isoform X3 [Dreissena polymorpha]XP_052241434.1 uncharacterized protein LOC127851656 isoform X3 [Dreissena polymorpha]XP_052241435.1 uncharacterized protein LOC127851656 isoform X3 [Dreissena polymorpha]KAH3736594.1 hypothetical protein DPMN_043165 [Dreissena polymorpha]